MGAAWIAIRRSLSSTTMEALRPVSESDGSAARPGRGIAIGLLALVSSWFVALTPPGLDYAVLVALVLTGNCLAYLGGALLAPGLVALAGRLLRPIAARMPLPVELAFENLARDLRRSGATVATIIVAVAMAATVTGTVESFNRAVLGWIHQRFDADLFVGAGTRFQLYGGTPMAAEMGAVLRATPGVASAEPFRVRRIEVGGQPVFLQGLDLDSRLAHGGLAMVDGELADVAAALRAGTGALVSDNLAYQQRLQRGDQVTIATAHGPHSYRVEGIYTDYLASLDLGAVTVGYDEFVRQWDDHVVNLFRLWLQPGAEATTVRADLLRRLGGARGYFVLTAGQFRESVERLLNGFFAAAWGLQLVAGLVGVIGVVNAQLATVLDRSREIQALRTIGVARRDITRATLTECALLGTIGGVGGVMVGTTIGAQIVLVALHLVTGLRIPFRTAASPLVAGVIAAAVVSALAGWVPARAAAQVELPRGPSE